MPTAMRNNTDAEIYADVNPGRWRIGMVLWMFVCMSVTNLGAVWICPVSNGRQSVGNGRQYRKSGNLFLNDRCLVCRFSHLYDWSITRS